MTELLNRPFPYNTQEQFGIRPSVSQEQLDSDVSSYYDSWKNDFLKPAVSYPGCYYISTGGGTNVEADTITVSEGHGYGMITVVLMAGYDNDAKVVFDGLYHFFRKHPSTLSPQLPSWQVRGIVGKNETDECFPSATDGDFDVAYSLLLADKQWGSDGDINYLTEAIAIIKEIFTADIHSESFRILLGDWVNGEESEEKYLNSTRPSDWMPAQLRAFAEADTNSDWNRVIETLYMFGDTVAHKTTGLLPDFVVNEPPRPAEPNFLEKETDGSYGANACRVPWRIGLDYIHFGTKEAYTLQNNMMNWLNEASGETLLGTCNGYELDGTPTFKNNYSPWGMYASPFMVAATCDQKYQTFLDSSWEYLSEYNSEFGYYSNSITILCLLAVSGNWWNPTV